MSIKRLFSGFCILTVLSFSSSAGNVESYIAFKTPGNAAVTMPVEYESGRFDAGKAKLSRVEKNEGDATVIHITVKASEDIYFNYGECVSTGYDHNTSLMFMPGFWYRRNLRSPEEAPSFHTSDSWVVREDRLSTPLTAVYCPEKGQYIRVLRTDSLDAEGLTTHRAGEVIVSGNTSIGYSGFANDGGKTVLRYGFPYREEPRSYIRKLTLAPSVEAFQHLAAGDSISLSWEITRGQASDFGECVSRTWEYCYDKKKPEPLTEVYSPDRVKSVLSNFFKSSFVPDKSVKYFSGVELETATCNSMPIAEVGFVGRTLLNAFNAIEYGDETGNRLIADNGRSVFDSYLENGFTPEGLIREKLLFSDKDRNPVLSIRRQSEGAYAALLYLQYERENGRRHKEWEGRVRSLLDYMVGLQNADGSFPRKFRGDHSLVDSTGGSTPSATLPLIMGYKYFKDKRYLAAGRRTIDYLEKELISKSDYFSSTLDANCEDKEASLAAATAAYYVALVSKGKERARCTDLCRKAAYFALSWYYTYDVPFAPGQMLGDIGLKTRGWGNVSVENNHIDVFVFEFADVLRWLTDEYGDSRFASFADVISSSLSQLLPYDGHMCGIASTGYYPEVVQHTAWDYGRNGKGYYNNIFAPGWTVASLWQLYTPGRAARFLSAK